MKQEAEDLFKKKRIDMSIYMHSMHVMCNLSKYIYIYTYIPWLYDDVNNDLIKFVLVLIVMYTKMSMD